MSEYGDLTYEQQLELVARDLETAKKAEQKHAALKRLTDNKDFKEIILEGFLEKEAVRAVGLLADVALRVQGEVATQAVKDVITSIGGLRQYFILIENMGRAAVADIAESTATQAEILEEQEAANAAETIQ